MRTIGYAVLAAAAFAGGCSSGDIKTADADNVVTTDFITITGVDPDRGPQAGGNQVSITGTGFVSPGAGVNNFLIGDSLAVASILSDTEALVTIPAAVNLEEVDITAFNGNGSFTLAAAYSYNPTPTVSAISPGTALNVGGQEVTLTGSGFADLEPGENRVFIGTEEAAVVNVVSDSELVIETPAGRPPRLLDVHIENDNGSADLEAAFRYTSNGVLVFRHRSSGDNAIASETLHADPDIQVVESALAPKDEEGFEGISVIALNPVTSNFIYKSNGNQRLFQLSSEGVHSELGPVEGCNGTRFQAMAFHGGELFAFCPNPGAGIVSGFGTIDLQSMRFEPIGSVNIAGQRKLNLTSNGTDLVFMRQNTLGIIDPATGDTSAEVDTGLNSVRGMAFSNGKLFVNSLANTCCGGPSFLLEVNPQDGTSTQVMILGNNIHGVTAVP